ncbi:hypothetical protein AK812_SmicGene31437 [Symbiodinium microadriaticum]|uniref:Uncharacterized protein n=1 Tax=Symbiodinium microadriaticum TaxID=2951 RepID=A0A1Q9CWS9_SYMMI|nr:hypothetical protein AK812_SmicGene31437 [Symbiodinium microadriaticum]
MNFLPLIESDQAIVNATSHRNAALTMGIDFFEGDVPQEHGIDRADVQVVGDVHRGSMLASGTEVQTDINITD